MKAKEKLRVMSDELNGRKNNWL